MDDTRRLWTLFEPVHAVVYFAPELRTAYEELGLRGFWRGYFAGRAAPLGEVEAGVVTACFFGFAPGFVARAIPSVWSLATPSQALAARLAGVDAALTRLLDPSLRAAAGDAAAALRAGLAGCGPAGRPMFAANAGLPWPAEPHLALWHAATLLREHRGDAHVAALTVAGLDPCEAHVTQVAAAGVPLDTIAPYRGWTDRDWQDAAARLAARGWLAGDGSLTDAGRDARRRVEDDTNRLAAEAVRALEPGDRDDVVAVLRRVVAPLVESGTIPYPNPIGVPAPAWAGDPPGPASPGRAAAG